MRGCCPRGSAGSALDAVELEELEAGGLELVDGAAGEAVHEVEAEGGVEAAGRHDGVGVDGQGVDEGQGLCVEDPALGGVEPAQADDVALFEGLDDDLAAVGGAQLDGDAALEQDEEAIGGLPLAQEELAGLEAGCDGGLGHDAQGALAQAGEAGRGRQGARDVLVGGVGHERLLRCAQSRTCVVNGGKLRVCYRQPAGRTRMLRRRAGLHSGLLNERGPGGGGKDGLQDPFGTPDRASCGPPRQRNPCLVMQENNVTDGLDDSLH